MLWTPASGISTQLIVSIHVIRFVIGRARIHATGQIQEFDLAELCRMTFSLDRDVSLAEQCSVSFNGWIELVHTGAADLRQIVFENGLSVDGVLDVLRAANFHFNAYPLVSAIRRRGRVRAVSLDHRSVAKDFRAGRAHVGRRAIAGWSASKQLHFDGYRKILILRHRFRSLAMNHQTVVPQRPRWCARRLSSHKPVLRRKN